ncbi:MAG: hypothetical protein I8H91_03210 [Burkholderiales bacterium]|nr:hypothetical protein [Burkholderiales bacterium]
MGFFSDMGFWEKVAFVVALPVIAPIAVAGAAYEGVTGNKVFSDSDNSSTESEQEARERVEHQAKEKRAEEERKAIVFYAKIGLIALQKSHSITEEPVPSSFNFTQLRKAVKDNQKSVEILTQLVAGASENDIASVARQELTRLNKEIKDLKKLRQVIVDIKTSEVDA